MRKEEVTRRGKRGGREKLIEPRVLPFLDSIKDTFQKQRGR